jgi:hypothetical protein
LRKLIENDVYVRIEKDDSKIFINSVNQDDISHLNQNIRIDFIYNQNICYSFNCNLADPQNTHWIIPFGSYSHENDDILLKFYDSANEFLFDINLSKNYGSHIYNKIDGWFDFQSVYFDAVKNGRDGDHFVEIGAWLGRSSSFMATEIKNSGKRIQFDIIDTWKGSNEIYHEEFIKQNGSVYELFLKNTESLKEYINPIIECSYLAPKYYKDRSLDFVYIDADHSYEIVKKDIKSWYPKVKIGGVIAGHDYYNSNQVISAVHDTIGADIITNRLSWIHHKKTNNLPTK